jgi:hypothetical protein
MLVLMPEHRLTGSFSKIRSPDAHELPTPASPILPLHLRPALSAGVAIVQRAGPEMLSMLRGHMMGENKARFGNAIEEIVDCGRQSRRSLQLHLI